MNTSTKTTLQLEREIAELKRNQAAMLATLQTVAMLLADDHDAKRHALIYTATGADCRGCRYEALHDLVLETLHTVRA